MKRLNLYILLFLLLGLSANAQFTTRPYADQLKTLQVHRVGWPLSYPVLYLGTEGEAVAIHFDILDAELYDINYSVIHCDANWRPSDLSVNEYLDGFQNAYLDSYEYSRSANIEYVNYRLQLPNPDVKFLLSGNYAVVFINEANSDTLATACFSVVDSRVSISGNVGGISSAGNSKEMQQLNFTVDFSNYSIQQPINETKVIVKQNNSPLRQAKTSTPTYVHADRLIFDHHPQMAFPGGDEYRVFETSSIRFAAEGVREIAYFQPYYHASLHPDKCRSHENYVFDDDINGKFLVRRQESADEDAATECDYLIVHFLVPMDPPIFDGKVYVDGRFSYHQTIPEYQMVYDDEIKAYKADIMVKQGYYNYRYFVKSNRNGEIKSQPIELDAHQTENDYLIYFYHRPMGERYDRLVGYQVINSIRP